MSCTPVERVFPHWFVFGGYSDPAFKYSKLYDADAPCDISDGDGDVFTHIPYPIAQKLIAARMEFQQKLEEIAKEYPELMEHYEERR